MLTNDLRRRLVTAQGNEAGLAHDAFTRPLGELHFADQLRLDPAHTAGLGGGQFPREWRLVPCQLAQLRVQGLERGVAEAGADPPGIAQPIGLVHRQQQRAEACLLYTSRCV